jgi:hypothetical protein
MAYVSTTLALIVIVVGCSAAWLGPSETDNRQPVTVISPTGITVDGSFSAQAERRRLEVGKNNPARNREPSNSRLELDPKRKRYLLLLMSPYTELVRNHEEGRRAKLQSMRLSGGEGGATRAVVDPLFGNSTSSHQHPPAHFNLYKLLMGI